MQASIELNRTPAVQYLLRIGDTCLVLAQRLGEWCGHAPVLEEDIAMANIALDLVGQARALLTHTGKLEGAGREHDEDQLAYLRDERDYFNLTIAELPRGDFAFAVVRNTMVSTRRIERRRSGRHRRQGREGSALPPAALGRLGGAPGRRHRRIAPTH
jgi:ring-1,2-phenylacetyl-CoA epoxidase subunit PaaC